MAASSLIPCDGPHLSSEHMESQLATVVPPQPASSVLLEARNHDDGVAVEDAEKGSWSQKTVPSPGDEGNEPGQYLVDFDGPDDPSNPINWSRGYKWAMVILLSAVTLIANFATVMCIPAVPQILAEFGSSDTLYQAILVSIWELGEAIGPLLTAPLSEIYGRSPVYNVANIIFIVFSLACAGSSNLHMLVAFRFFSGIGDASIALNPGIIGDMFVQEERGFALSIMGLPPLLGPVAGPVLGGFLTQAKGWRWAFWLSAITGGVCEICFLAFFRETYKPRILQKKSRRLRKQTGKKDLRSKYDNDPSVKGSYIWRQSIIRPAQMLVRSPIVLLLALYVSVVYGFLYLLLTTITEVFETTYRFSQGAAGLAYLGLGLGMVTGVLLCALTSDWYLKKQHAIHGDMKPEYRLPPMVLGGVLIPIGLFLYGWTVQSHVFFIVPMIGTATLGLGFFVTTIPLSAYLIDAYKVHAASAIAATIVMRCVVGAVLPLAGPPLYAHLGLGWGNSLLGFLAILFVPVPMLFMRYGERIRKSSSIKVVD